MSPASGPGQVGHSQRVEWDDGSVWTVTLVHLSDARRTLSFGVVGAGPAVPVKVKLKVREVSSTGASFVECAATLAPGASPAHVVTSETFAAHTFADLRALVGAP